MVEQVRALGPLGLPQRFEEWDREMTALEHAIAEKSDTEVAHA